MTCRNTDGPIPWTAVALYADKKGFEPDTADLLWSVIRAMDLAERRWIIDNLDRPDAEIGQKGGDQSSDA